MMAEEKDKTDFKIRVPQRAVHENITLADIERINPVRLLIYKLLILLNGANHFAVVFLAGMIWSYSSNGPDALTPLQKHIRLCTIGYVVLMSQGLLALVPENIWSYFCSKSTKKHLHWVLQLAGGACSIAGVAILYCNMKTHFHSTHALTGIVSVGIMCFLIVFGYPVLVVARLRKVIRPVVIQFTHNLLGIVCFVVGMASLCYSYEKKWMKSRMSINEISPACLVLTILATIFPLVGALRSLRQQVVGLFC